MNARPRSTVLSASLTAFCLAMLPGKVAAQDTPANVVVPANASPTAVRLTLEEVKHRILSDNKLLQLAAHNIQSKEYATKAMRANYFPQVIGTSVYFHFNDNLGDVLSTRGRIIRGPRGTPLAAFPPVTVDIPLTLQDSSFSTITMVQPITALLKVRQGVKLAQADEQIAQAQMEQGTRELLSGAEQLFWGILAAQRIRGGTVLAIAGAEQLAKTGNLEARMALVEAKQGLQQVDTQLADLLDQLTTLLEMPPCTQIELVEPPLPIACVKCAEEAVQLALETSPEVHEAEQNINKAHAAVKAAKVDYLPNVAVVGGYANNSGMIDVVQSNIGYVGVVGTYTFIDWGHRRNVIRERQELIAMATLKVQTTQDEVRKNALKAFRDYEQSREANQLAGELLELRQSAQKAATAPAAMFKAAKDTMTAQVDAVKADLAHRIAYVKLMSIIGKP